MQWDGQVGTIRSSHVSLAAGRLAFGDVRHLPQELNLCFGTKTLVHPQNAIVGAWGFSTRSGNAIDVIERVA